MLASQFGVIYSVYAIIAGIYLLSSSIVSVILNLCFGPTLQVNVETARVKLSLQQSMCSSMDSSFIQGYFVLDQKVIIKTIIFYSMLNRSSH